jgi:hypothetical protein
MGMEVFVQRVELWSGAVAGALLGEPEAEGAVGGVFEGGDAVRGGDAEGANR